MAIAAKLYYGGQTFNLSSESARGFMEGIDGVSSGTVSVRTERGEMLTIVIGPGIPVALVEERSGRTQLS